MSSVTVTFAYGTVIIVLAIFAVFTFGAFKAEKVVAAKAKAIRDAQPKAGASKATVVKTKKK